MTAEGASIEGLSVTAVRGEGAMVLALAALPAADLGGVVVGTVLGVVGAAACLAWQPAT